MAYTLGGMATSPPPPAGSAKGALSKAEVEHVAKLASLSLAPGEAEAFTAELAGILAYVEQLGALDTSAVPPTLGGGVASPGEGAWRPDTVVQGLDHDAALAAAPRTADGGFAVPTFVDPGATR